MSETPQQPSAPEQPTTPSAKQDTTMAWLAHLLMLFTLFLGPLVIWLVKKDEDKYAAFHAKQAMCWGIVVFIVLVFLAVFSSLLLLVPVLGFLGWCVFWVAWVGHIAYGIVGTILTAQGKPHKYILVADKFCKNEFAEAYPDAPSA